MLQITRRLAKPILAIALLGSLSGALHAQPASQMSPVDTLKTQLKITGAQESAWKQFTETYAMPFKPSQDMTAEKFNAMKTPARIAFLKSLRVEETGFLAKRLDASLALYNALDDSQKATFDNMTAQQPMPVQAPAASKGKKK